MREVLLPDLKPGMAVALEALPPPEPLYLAGKVSEIVARCVVVQMAPPAGESIVRLDAGPNGDFQTAEGRPVRVFVNEVIG